MTPEAKIAEAIRAAVAAETIAENERCATAVEYAREWIPSLTEEQCKDLAAGLRGSAYRIAAEREINKHYDSASLARDDLAWAKGAT